MKKEWQAAWLLRAISCMDLTTLSGDDTEERVRRLCAKARQPIQDEIGEAPGDRRAEHRRWPRFASITVLWKPRCGRLRRQRYQCGGCFHGISRRTFSGGRARREIRRSVEAGADEIDVVITRAHVFGASGRNSTTKCRVQAACGPVHMKAILGTGDLLTLRNVARASFVAMMAGADFIKTSTGKESTNATLPVGLVMTRAIREYAQETGMAVGFKPAGGIRTAKQSTEWLALMKEELGTPWMKADLFRFGASSLLNDIERQLEHYATGRYSAEYRHPIRHSASGWKTNVEMSIAEKF